MKGLLFYYYYFFLFLFIILFCPFCLIVKSEKCYDELGCFPMDYPWTSSLRPLPPPMNPKSVNTHLLLYTRSNMYKRRVLRFWPNITMSMEEATEFQPQRSCIFIIHGYLTNGGFSWQQKMKDAYLKHRDANIFVVDWGRGAQVMNYLQAASNTRIVGAELARFGKYLIMHHNANPSDFHVIGHSLGAQIGSYFCKRLNKTIGRLTGLDPAQPGFEGCVPEVRITKNDAIFVDVLHTNIRPFSLLGFGMIHPVGDVDIYPNGGFIQPGCPHFKVPFVNTISELINYSVEDTQELAGCSHVRSIHYFTESIEREDCIFWARAAKINSNQQDNNLIELKPLVNQVNQCTLQTCIPVGLQTQKFPARGTFYLTTNSRSKYCQSDVGSLEKYIEISSLL